MSPARKRFKIVKVNLVDQPGWKPWDPGGRIGELAYKEAWQYMGRLGSDSISLLQDLAGNLYKPLVRGGPHEWSPRDQLTSEDLDLISMGLQKGHLGLVRQAITDAADWMYQEALTPQDGDCRYAVDKAEMVLEENFNLDEELWASILEPVSGRCTAIIRSLVHPSVQYERKEGHYDRFLEFDLNQSPAPRLLLEKTPLKDRRAVFEAILEEWKRLSQMYIEEWFAALTNIMQNIMQNVDPSNRTHWVKHWKATLLSVDMPSIRREMLDYVREARKQGGSRR